MTTRGAVRDADEGAAPDCVLVLDPATGTVLDADGCREETCCHADTELCGRTLCEIAPADWSPPADLETLVDRARDGEAVTFEWPVERDGRRSHRLSLTLSVLDVDGNGTERLIATGSQLTPERNERQARDGAADAGPDLSSRDRTMWRAFEHAGHAVYVTDVDGTIEYVNPTFEELTGYSGEEAVGATPAILNAGVMDEAYYEALWETILDGEVWHEEIENERADGSRYVAEQTIAPIVEDGTVTEFVAIQQDVTERSERQRDLERHSQAMAAASDGLSIVDEEGRFSFVNEAMAVAFGYEEPAALVGRHWQSLYEAPEVERLKSVIQGELLAAGEWHGEAVGKRTDGTTFPHDLSLSLTDDGRTVTVCRDITDRKRREQQLERYEQLIRNVPVGVYRNTPGVDGEFEEVNPAMVELFDADSEAALLETPVASLYRHPDQRAEFSERLRETGRVVDEELRLQTLDGEPFWGAVTAIRHEVDGEVYYDGIIQDITERKENAREVRVREQRFRRLFEDHSAPMLLIDPDTGEIERANDAAAEFYGYDRAALTALHIQDINQLSDEEVAARRENAAEQEDNTFIFPHELANGEIRQVEVHSSPIHTGDGELLFSILNDVTDREAYRAEVERKNERLEVLNRVVRHDIRNDMAAVIGNAEVLETRVDDDAAGYVETIEEHSKHAVELTETVRDLMDAMLSGGEQELQPMGLAKVLGEEIDELAKAYPAAEIRRPSSCPDVPVAGNEMLTSVFRNVLNNAIQHNDADSREVTVTATERAETVQVRVVDNGSGIPDAQKEDVFGKGERGIESSGTGLGLYLVYTFVDQFGGEVWVEDADTGGAAFVIELPKAD